MFSIIDIDIEVVKLEGFDECIAGVVDHYGMPTVLLYDRDKCLQVLINNGLSYEEALEHFEFNIEEAYFGDCSPCFVTYNINNQINTQ